LKVRDSATLVRGVDKEGNFDHEPRPQRDLDEAALAAHADAVARQVKALYSGTDKQAFRA
jgi:non-heme Fe2+,alpha-ketoglutarate-dependent halogenase